MQISEVSKKYGLTHETLRYYEKEGLIGPVPKEKSGKRNYREQDLNRIEFIKCMRSAGLEISFLKKYIKLLEQGESTVNERKELLEEQRKIIRKKLDKMQTAYDKLNYKIDLYNKNIKK